MGWRGCEDVFPTKPENPNAHIDRLRVAKGCGRVHNQDSNGRGVDDPWPITTSFG